MAPTFFLIRTMLEQLPELFAVNMPPWEIVVRGTAVYWSLFLVFRFLVRRDIGAVGVADLLVLVLVADAAQNAMAGGYETITEGLILVGTLIGWNMLFDWLAYRSKVFARFMQAPPLLLVRNGRIIHRNLRREFVTVDDLLAKLRGHGVDDVAAVAKAYLESDGEFTVICRRGQADTPPATAKDRVA